MGLFWAAAGGAAQAQSVNLYGGSVSVPTISFANGPMNVNNGATISLGVGSTPVMAYVMDTGSNGILISQDKFNPTGATYVGMGTETLTSDGITYTGKLYTTNVGINNVPAGGGPLTLAATATVTVLDVTSTTTCAKVAPFNCTTNTNPTDIAYMGVGFNRNVSTVTPDVSSQVINTNPFINIVSIGPGHAAATGINQGYIITDSGVTLGLTSANTTGYALVKLTPDPGATPTNQPGTIWGQAPVVLSVGGHAGAGTILPDAGINYAFLTPPVYVGQTTCPGTPQPACLPSNVPVLVYLPGQATPVASYTLTQAGSPLTPTEIALNPPDSTTFLNTGRLFYQGFDYFYDPTNGYVGYYATNAAVTFTPALALTGTVALPDGFQDSLPTYLFGPTIVQEAGTGTISSVVSGPGSLILGSGTLVLQGINTYTGGTIVDGGTLQMGPGASLAPTGALTINAGKFDLNNNDMTIGPLSGAGGVLALGSGTLTVNTSGYSTLASQITGTGGLNIQGNGVLALTGANTFTGPTAISSGTLAVDGQLTSNVTTSGTGTLSGGGQVVGNVVNGGMVAPGVSIGTLSVVGDFSQTASGRYQVEVNGQGANDRLTISGASGTATLGGSVFVAPQAGSYAPKTTYTILSATGGVTGTYASVASSLPFLLPSLSYGTNKVFLSLQIGGFAAAAQTPTQATIGAVLDATVATATGNYATVLGALSTLSAAEGQAVMTSISGQNYAGFSTAGVLTAQLFMSNFAAQAGGGSGGTNRVALAQACDIACDGAPPSGDWGAWGGPIGGLGTIGINAPVGGLTYNLAGFAAGLDRKVTPNLLFGVTAGYTSGTDWVSGFQGSGTSNTVQTGLYGVYSQGPAYLDALVGYAYSSNQMSRPLQIPGLAPMTAQGRTGANQFFGQLETGYRVEVGGTGQAFVTPFARLQGSTSTQNAFNEWGAGSLDLSVAAQTTNSVRSVLGAQLGWAMDMGWLDKLALKVSLGWGHEYADTDRPVTASFAGAPAASFTTYGIAPQRDGAVVGFAANTAIAKAASIYVRYEGNLTGQDSSHALSAGVRMTW